MISSNAEISKDAKLGEGVKVGAYSIIEGDVEIGDGTWIGPHVTIMDGARIGKNCQIFPGTVISANPQDLKFVGEYAQAIIGDNNLIRENVTFNKGTKSKGRTIMGSNCLIMSNAHIGHDCTIGSNNIIGFSVGMAGEVEVGDFVNISGMCGIHQFVRIGSQTMIEGLSKIVKDVPPFIKAGHEPLSYAGLNIIGLKRRNFTPESIEIIHNLYRVLYQQGLNVSQAMNYIESNFAPSPEKDEVVNFIKKAERGIIGRYRAAKKSEE
jgi:UDP-N-acetylglucosamine acyltransferase